MKEILEKISIILAELLIYSTKIESLSKPKFTTEGIIFNISDSNKTIQSIFIEYSILSKLHDHTLECYIIKLMKEKNLI